MPDPYPIDDDLDGLDDESPTPTPRPEPSRRKSKRDSVQPAEPLTAPPSADDPVVVDRMNMDAEPPPAEAERPRHRERERERDRERDREQRPRRERGNSDAMGTLAGVAGTAAAVSGFKNMFGLGRKKTTAAAPDEDRRDRRKTAYETEDERRRRKRSTTTGGMTEDEAKRLRHERRSVRKSTRAPDGEPEPLMTGANGNGEYDPEREARRAARRARHEQEKDGRRAEEEVIVEPKTERRRERTRDVDPDATLVDKKARQMAALAQKNEAAKEELRRQAEKDERRKSRKPTDDTTRDHRSSRRRDKEPRDAPRPHTERRRSHMSRRTSTYPAEPEPVNSYFDARNANAKEEQNQPYINKGPDKTQSWVQSLSDEPPLPPPISETVLDPPGAPLDDDETPSQDDEVRMRMSGRSAKKEKERERASAKYEQERPRDERKHGSRRKTHYEGVAPEVKKDRRRSYAPGAGAYEETPVRTWDGRPAADGNGGAGKRGSWLKKLF